MAVNYYGFGPEFQGAQLVMKGATGDLLTIPAGVGPFSIPDDIAASGLLKQLDTPQFDDPLTPYPRYAGNTSLGVTMFPLMADSKRITLANLPSGYAVSKVRAYVDGAGNGPGDPVARITLFDGSGVAQATSDPVVLGRNTLLQTAAAQGAGVTAVVQPAGHYRINTPGTVGDEGTFYAPSSVWNAFPGEQITVSAWMKGAAGGETVRFQPRFGNSAGALLANSNGPVITLTTEWQRYSYTLTVPVSPDGCVHSGVKIVSTVVGAQAWDQREVMLSRGDALLPYHADRVEPGWVDFSFSSSYTPFGTIYMGLHTGSDLAVATTNTVNTMVTQVNFDANVTGWTANGAGAVLSYDTAVKRSGAGSAKMSLTAAATGQNLLGPSVGPFNPGDKVTVIAYIRPTIAANVGIGLYGNSTGIWTVGSNVAAGAGAWVKVTHSYTMDKTGTLQVMLNVGQSATFDYNVDDLTVQVQRRNSSNQTSLRLAGVDASNQDVNLVTNTRGQIDATGFSSFAGGTSGSSISLARVTSDHYLLGAGGASTCIEYTGTAGTTLTTPYMIGPAIAGSPAGGVFQATMAFKLVSGTISNFKAGVRTVDASNTNFGFITLGTLTNPTVGRWYYFSGQVTLPTEQHTLQPSVTMDVPAGNSYVGRLGFVQLSRNPLNALSMIDGDLPAHEWDGTAGSSTARGPMGRVNWIRDPRTVTSAQWSANQASVQMVSDPTSPTGNALRVYNNTGVDGFGQPSYFSISDLRVPALPGEQWTLTGWMKPNAAAIAAYTNDATQYKNGPNLWTRSESGYANVFLNAAGRPSVANEWMPFAITATIPVWNSSLFIRLYNSPAAVSGPETLYTGLKLEKGVWPAGDYFSGSSSGSYDWFGTANASNPIKWQEPDVGDLFADGAANLPNFQPNPPNIFGGPVLQPAYV